MEQDRPERRKTDYEYKTLMNMLRVSVSKHLLDEHFTMVWANDFYYELIGYSESEYEELFHNQCDRYYVDEEKGFNDREEWDKIGKLVISSISEGKDGYSLPTKMRRKDGEYVWVRMAGTFTQEYIDGCRVSYTVMTDITDIMRMRLEQSVTYDNLPGFIGKYRVHQEFRLTLLEANDRFVDFFGPDCFKSEEDPLFRHNLEQNMEVLSTYKSQMLAGEPVRFTVRMNDQCGREAWLQINAACVERINNDPVYLVIFIDVTDETELRRMQKKLETQADELRAALDEAKKANRAKSDFLSRMSHDIRTPMNAIIGMTDIAKVHMDDERKVWDCLNKISLSSQHLLGLINDVLDMSKIESGKMALHNDIMSLPEVMENVVAIMQPQFKERDQKFSIRLVCVRHEQFTCDVLRLRQVFINILSNACKFTPNGGKIMVEVREEKQIDAKTASFRFTFSDNGIGMKPEFLEHIFDAFSREMDSRVDKTEGTGLGMAITKKIVDLLGGTIEVDSVPGKGTIFQIKIPLKIEEMPVQEKSFPDLKILIADDDDIMCECTVLNLRELGIYTECVSSGQEALTKVEEARRKGDSFDAVFLDWRMPSEDGVLTTRRIREICGYELPILIISAYDWSDIRDEATDAGVTGFLSKPVFISTLCRALQKYVLGKKPDQYIGEKYQGWELKELCLLLVEDNEINREVAKELLSDFGAKVEMACDGAQGVEAFRQSREGYYDMILMDVQMPVMDGYAATENIRSLERPDAATVPILALTADAFAEDIIKAREAGMNGHLAKPLDGSTLKREIGKYLQRG